VSESLVGITKKPAGPRAYAETAHTRIVTAEAIGMRAMLVDVVQALALLCVLQGGDQGASGKIGGPGSVVGLQDKAPIRLVA
jgi:hypothetical protein